jgi:hypothetical protein
MTQEEIKAFIVRLKADTENGQASFGVYKYANSPDEVYIKANKQGLQLFASEILQAITQVDETISNERKNIIPIDYGTGWIDEQSDTCIQYIEPVIARTAEKRVLEETGTLKDRAFNYGCIAGLILLLIATATGIVTILKWIF